MELFKVEKQPPKRCKGKFATELQFLRQENKQLKNRIELLERQRPSWIEIRNKK